MRSSLVTASARPHMLWLPGDAASTSLIMGWSLPTAPRCKATAGSVKLLVGFTDPAGPITGTSPVNAGQTGVSYSISSVNGATTYTWTVPSGATVASGQGTTSITVDFSCAAVSGNVTVTPS